MDFFAHSNLGHHDEERRGCLPLCRGQQKRKLEKIQAARNENKLRLQLGRLMFLVTIALFAGVLGISFYLLSRAEMRLAQSQFESIADRALAAAAQITERQNKGLITLASIIGFANPRAEQWPFVYLDGFDVIASNVIGTSGGRALGFGPILDPSQAEEYEQFAFDYYYNVREPPFPRNPVAEKRGIWAVNFDEPDLSKRFFRDVSGNTTYGSPNNFLAPVLQHSDGAHATQMINIRFDEIYGRSIDDVVACQEQNTNSTRDCSSLTDFTILPLVDGPGAIIFSPVYPARDPNKLTGLVGSSIAWSSIFEDAFSHKVSGIDCVLSTENHAYTYRVTDGVAILVGDGDLHQSKYDPHKRSIMLNPEGLFGASAAKYKLTLYPSNDFYNSYTVYDPLSTGIGVTCFILFLLLCFFLYDYFVRQEFTAKQDLLEAKRKFVRFVSHEVRTPLNAVCMGLSLLQDEIGTETGVVPPDDVEENAKINESSKTRWRPSLTSMVSVRKMNLHGGGGFTKPSFVRQQSNISINSDKETSSQISQLAQTTNCDGSKTSIISRKSAKEWMKLVADAMENAQSSVDVLNDVLNYDKIETNNLTLELTVVPVWRLIASTAAEFQVSAAKKKISFRMRYHSEFDDDTTTAGGTANEACKSAICSRCLGDKARTSSLESVELGQDNRHSIASDRCLINDGTLLDRKVIGDSIRIQQVLRNLISNAMKFTPEGGSVRVTASCTKDPPIELSETSKTKRGGRWPRSRMRHQLPWEKNNLGKRSSSSSSGSSVPSNAPVLSSEKTQFEMHDGTTASFAPSGYLQVSVSDTGAGMSQEQLANLFRNGIQFNVNELQAGQGSGLGLFISKGLMEQHGGSLSADSAGLGCGTTFTMSLPLYFVPDEPGSDVDRSGGTIAGALSEFGADDSEMVLAKDDTPMHLEQSAELSAERSSERVSSAPTSIQNPNVRRALTIDHTGAVTHLAMANCSSVSFAENGPSPTVIDKSLVDQATSMPKPPVTDSPRKVKLAQASKLQTPSQATVPEATKPNKTAASKPKFRILIVDDAGTNRKLLRRLLERQGHICDDAADGQLACDKVSAALRAGWCYDTVLMDYEMPVMNGPTAVREIRKMLRSPEAKDALVARNASTSKSKSTSGYDGDGVFMVGITGNVLNEDVRFFLNSGADAVLPKPFKMPALKELWSEHGVKSKFTLKEP